MKRNPSGVTISETDHLELQHDYEGQTLTHDNKSNQRVKPMKIQSFDSKNTIQPAAH